MGTRVVQRLRDSGIEVSRDNENLVIEHFHSLPKRYAVAVKDAMAEILMHISLLQDSRRRNGMVTHSLRRAIANLPKRDLGYDTTGSLGSSYGSQGVSPLGSPGKHGNKHKIISSTPLQDSSVLQSESESESESYGMIEQDVFELTVAMNNKPDRLATVFSTLSMTGLSIAESHGFTTQDGYYIYWFVLQDFGKKEMCHFAALDNMLHMRFNLQFSEANGHHGQFGMRRSSGSQKMNGHGSNGNGNLGNGDRAPGMRRGSSFLNLWRSSLGVREQSVPDWEIDAEELKFLDKIGEGSFGAIHKGYYQGEIVAIKTIKSDFSKEFEYVKEFSQEISIISTLEHENIVKFKGACTKSVNVCIVYEFMDNGNLRDFLQREKHKTSVTQLLRFGLDIVKGMTYLSDKKIVHRDLKAANILITKENVVKIGDFGVSRLLPRDSACMTAETGTYRWMAPEVIEHKPYGSQADVYSFGIVLWELMTGGKTPYQLLSPVQAAVGVAKHEVRPKIAQSCPKYIADIMKACWHTSPENRPTFRDLVILLEDAIETSKNTGVNGVGGQTNGHSSNCIEKEHSPKQSRSFTSMLSKMIRM